MDLLNTSPVLALPVTMWAAAQVFAGTAGLTETDGYRRLSPLGLRESRDMRTRGDEPPPTNGAVQAVKALVELGLLVEMPRPDRDPVLRWTTPVPRCYDEFCAHMLGSVMARAHTEELGETRTPGGARDLLRGLAWILTKDPVADSVSSASVQADRAASQDDDARVFINSNRWNGFRYWSEALGFTAPVLVGAGGQSALNCDASRAVATVLRDMCQPGTERAALAIIDELRERLPVLPGGVASRALGFSVPADNALDAATSFALLALEQSGDIDLRMLSDGTGTIRFAPLDPAEPGRLVTHLVVREN